MRFQGKLMNRTWENGKKKTSFGTNFGPFGRNLGLNKVFHQFYFCYMLEIDASYHCMQFQEKLMNQTWEKSKKPSFRPYFGPSGPPKLFFKNLAPSATRYHGQLSSCKILEKTIDPIWRKLSDGRTDGQMDRQRDEWFHRMLSD